MSQKSINTNLKQLIAFVFTGGTCFVVDTLSYAFFINIANVNYLLAGIGSFLLSVGLNYYLSIRFVFHTEKKTGTKTFLFFLLSAGGLLLNECLLWLGVTAESLLLHRRTNGEGISGIVIKVFATGIVMIYNFITRKRLLEPTSSNR